MDPQAQQPQSVEPQPAPHEQFAAAAAETPALTPLYQTEVWHMPEGHFSVFGYRKAVAVVYPGWLVVYRKADHVELKRIPLAGDLKMKYFLNFLRIAQNGGQRYGLFNMKYSFFLGSMWSYAVLFAGVLTNSVYRLAMVGSYPDPGQSLVVQGFALLLMIGGLGWMAFEMPKAKTFILACKHAAGIAQ